MSETQFARVACQSHHVEEKDCPHRRSDVEEDNEITFWLTKRGHMKDSTLPSSNRFALAWRIIYISLPWMAVSALVAAFWSYYLDNTFSFDGFPVSVILGGFAFFAVGYWRATDDKRSGGGGAYVGLGSAAKNLFLDMQGLIDYKALAANPMVDVELHNGQKYVLIQMPAIQLIKWTAVTLNGILASVRNGIRGDVVVTKLPVYNPIKAELIALEGSVDPAETLQSLARRFDTALFDAGVYRGNKRVADMHNFDAIANAGALDIGGKVGVSAANQVFSLFMRVLATIVVPLTIRTAFDDYHSVWITPITLFFYYALFAIADRQSGIAVTQKDNYFTSIAVTKEMREGARTTYAIAANIARITAAHQAAAGGKQTLPIAYDITQALYDSRD